jgi:CubicO group peptidase (beta-lactamase class C family)
MKRAIATPSGMPTIHVDLSDVEQAARQAEIDAWTANGDKRNALAVLEKHDAKGFTRAWESAVAAIEDDLGEYDANVLAEKRAARAVVVG